MNRTRIEIATSPQELPAPHFDDEATIVSARQVVPITQAKVVERSRKVLSLVPVLIGAAVCGALGALAVNFYENHERKALVSASGSEISQPQNQSPAPTKGEASLNSGSDSAAGALAASESPTPGSEVSPTQTQNDTAGVDSATVDSRGANTLPAQTKPGSKTNEGAAEPGKLVRKRRVLPAETNTQKPENPPREKRGAGRIQEIFAGPNP